MHAARLVFVTLALALATPAIAEIEVIEVTAQKRASTLQDTNISLTVLSSSELEERQIEDVIDLEEFVPNVSFEVSANGNGFFAGARGIAQGDATLITRDPAVAVYIDGVYWGRTIGNLVDVLDIERIEVLRGPQGDLYGRNAAAGALNFVTRKPSGGYGTSMKLRTGSGVTGHDTAIGDLRVAQEFPIFGGEGLQTPDGLGMLAGSLSFATLNRREWFDNNSSLVPNFIGPPFPEGPDTDGRKRYAGRLALHHELNAFSADFAADYTYGKEQGPEMQLTNLDPTGTAADPFGLVPLLQSEESFARKKSLNVLGGTGALVPTAPNTFGLVPGPGFPDDETQAWGTSLTLQYDFENLGVLGGATLKSITGYRDVESDTYQDRDGAPLDIFSNFLLDDVGQWTEEITFVGEAGSGIGVFQYTVGYFFLHEVGKQTAGQWSFAAFGAPASISNPDIETDAHAVFGHFAFIPALGGWFENRVKAEFGLRNTWEKKTVENHTINLTPVVGLPAQFTCATVAGTNLSYGYTDCGVGGAANLSPVKASKDFSEFTPTGRLSLDVHETTTVYASVAKGYTAGGFNGRANDPVEAVTPYKEETNVTYEGGVKFQGLDNRIRLNVAGFFQEIDDLQRTQLTIFPGTSTVSSLIRNAASAEIAGVEIEMLVNPLERMFLELGYGLADTEFKLYCDNPGSGGVGLPNGGCPAGQLDFADSRQIRGTPKHNVHASFQYSIPVTFLGDAMATGRVDYYWQSQTLLQNGNREFAGQNSYGLWNLRVVLSGIQMGDMGAVDIAFWGRNLADREYKPFGIDFDSGGSGQIPFIVQYFGERRTLGVELAWRFGTLL